MTEVGYASNGYVKTKYFNYYAMLVIYIILLLPFLSLTGVQDIVGDTAYSVYQSAAMVLLFVLVLFKVRYIPKDLFSVVYLMFSALVIYSTTRNYGFSMGILVNTLAGFFIVLLIQRDGELIIRALTVISVVALIANLFSIMRLGINEHAEYFVGGKNGMSIFLVPSVFMMLTNGWIRKGRFTWSTIWFAVIAALIVFWTGSATGIVTVIAMGAGILWIRKNKLNVAVFMIGMVIAQMVLVFLIDILSGLPVWIKVLGWLGKEETLTSRAMIWNQSLEIIKDNWFIGAGRGVGIRYITSWGQTKIVGEAHNFFIELLLEGGILGFTLYMVLLWDAMKNLNMDSVLHRIIFTCFLAILVNGLAEAVNNKMYVTIVLALLNACSEDVLRDPHMGKNKLLRK